MDYLTLQKLMNPSLLNFHSLYQIHLEDQKLLLKQPLLSTFNGKDLILMGAARFKVTDLNIGMSVILHGLWLQVLSSNLKHILSLV